MKSIQVQAKNVQKAIEQGLKELNVSQEDVSIKIIDEGGLFRKAKVELTLDKEENRKEDLIKDEKVEKEKTKEEVKNKLEVTIKEEVAKVNNIKQEKKSITLSNNSEECIKKEKTKISIESAIELGKTFLKELTEKMQVKAEIEAFRTELGVTFNASGEKVNTLIGKRGETLNAIQEILSNVMKNAGFREEKVFFDVENYKNRREMSLISLAEKMAAKAIKINKPIRLERMNAYERKIIHTALQDMEGVTSKSEGEEPNRRLVIIPEKKN